MLLAAAWDDNDVLTDIEDASSELTASRFFDDLIRAVTTNTPVTVHADLRLLAQLDARIDARLTTHGLI
jgi:hypothetical protein